MSTVRKEEIEDLASRALCRMDTKDETLAVAVEAVTGHGSGPIFDAVCRSLRGETKTRTMRNKA